MSDKNIKIKSEAKTVRDQKAVDTDKMLAEMKKKEQQDAAKAKAAQKEANTKTTSQEEKETKDIHISKKSEDAIANAALAAGSAIVGNLTAKGKNGKKNTLWIILIIVAVLAGGFFLFRPQIESLLGFKAPQSLSDLKPDDVMGYNSIDFQNAILLESREKQELVVMEQDVEVTSEISHELANISLFKKTKKIHSFGTGVYTVDMSQINAEHIQVDDAAKTVTVTIPKSILQYVQPDIEKTTFEDTEHGILGFGEIKMTQEQQGILTESIDAAMREELNQQELFDKANEIALLKVREIFQPLITEVSDQFIVKVIQ